MLNLLPGDQGGQALVRPDGYTPFFQQPVEIKSLRIANSFPVYKFRLEKDLPETLYVLGIHNRGPSKTLREIWTGLAETLSLILIIDKVTIQKLIKRRCYKIRKIKSVRTKSGKRNGYQRKGYVDGYYNIPFTDLLAETKRTADHVTTELHGLSFKANLAVDHRANLSWLWMY